MYPYSHRKVRCAVETSGTHNVQVQAVLGSFKPGMVAPVPDAVLGVVIRGSATGPRRVQWLGQGKAIRRLVCAQS